MSRTLDLSMPELGLFVEEMQQAALPAPVIEAFCRLYGRYRQGDPGKLTWSRVRPPGAQDLVPYEELQRSPLYAERGRQLLGQLVVISLNGGLGTTMKLERAKSLIAVREGETFLDLKARQVLSLAERYGVRVPWLLMNSYHTREESLQALERYPELRVAKLPLDFLQNKFPRIERATRLPLALPDPEENWAPPGHGDIYLALWLTGILGELLRLGYRWAFVSNIDNLASTPDPTLLGFLAERSFEFAMEVAQRSPADVKGGTLIRYLGNTEGPQDRLMLMERTQVDEQHLEEFQDLSLFSVFNTNSLWWQLEAVLKRLQQGKLELPMIVNPKTVQSVEAIQLETAMGAAIGCFGRAVGLRVPRSRFAPVKATADLLAVRSDAYLLDEDFAIRPNPTRPTELGPPVVQLDERYYKGMADFETRWPAAPSLLHCRQLTVMGDIHFGRDVRFEGEVVLRNRSSSPQHVPDGTVFAAGSYELG